MRSGSQFLPVLAAAVTLLTPAVAAAGFADVFATGPRLDLATELDYRGRYLTTDDMVRDELPADRFGREQLADVKTRAAREYMRHLGDAMLDEVLDRVPLFADLVRRYQRLTTFHLSRRAPPEEPCAARLETGIGCFRGDGGRARAQDSPPVVLRLRLAAGGTQISPGLEVSRGPLRCRLGFDAARERIELTFTRRILPSAELELGHTASLRSGEMLSRLVIRLPF